MGKLKKYLSVLWNDLATFAVFTFFFLLLFTIFFLPLIIATIIMFIYNAPIALLNGTTINIIWIWMLLRAVELEE